MANAETTAGEPEKGATRYAWYVLSVLFLVYVLNFVDRQIISILAEDIKRDLDLTDADLGFMRWLTVRVPGDTKEILLERPGPPAHDPATAEEVRALVTKGAGGGWLGFNTDDVDGLYEKLAAQGVEITQVPTDQSYGRDFGLRDPFGNNLRIGRIPAA